MAVVIRAAVVIRVAVVVTPEAARTSLHRAVVIRVVRILLLVLVAVTRVVVVRILLLVLVPVTRAVADIPGAVVRILERTLAVLQAAAPILTIPPLTSPRPGLII
jgi:hypothetical protein